MRYIVSKQIINDNIMIANSLVGSRSLSLMFKEYYEMLYQRVEDDPSGEIFGISIDGSVCYALGMASMHNKGAVVNNLIDIAALHSSGMNLFYIPIDTMDGREGMSVYEASQLAKNIHKFVDNSAKIMGMVTNGCINDRHLQSKEEWNDIWKAFDRHLAGISAGGSFWLNKTELLPDFVTDIRIGRFMLFGIIPYSDDKIGKNCMVIEGKVLGVNLNSGKVMVDLGDAYCNPKQCEPYNQDLKLSDTSSNYAMYSTPNAGNYYLGQRLLFTPNYGHSSALSRLNIHFDYE